MMILILGAAAAGNPLMRKIICCGLPGDKKKYYIRYYADLG